MGFKFNLNPTTFATTYVTLLDGSKYRTLMVAPLSVLIETRGMGVGVALMQEGLRLVAEMGYETAFLCGAPNYYLRLGYKHTYLYDINHESIPQEYVLVYEIKAGSLAGVTGVIKL